MIQLPIDGGPLYAETNLSRFPVEPWNALSSFALIIPALYWAFRMKFRINDFSFAYLCIALLLSGGIGSVLYHAFRTSEVFLVMDVLPAAILTIIIGIYFWNKVLANWFLTALIIIPFVGIRFLLLVILPEEMAVNIGYFLAGSMFLIPILLYVRKHNFSYVGDIVLSIVFLIISLIFREFDQYFSSYISIGSHFLWHIFSGIGAFFLGNFLYRLRDQQIHL